MKTLSKIVIVSILFAGCTAQQITKTINDYLGDEEGLTSADIASGLKEALVTGITKGSNEVSRLDGYLKNPNIKIPFPPEVQKVEQKLRDIGLGVEVDNFITTLNRGAEEAAKEAKPIFVSAITSMTIQDAWSILKGDDKEAATNYLRKTTSDQLRAKFAPIMKDALDKVNATKYYSEIITTYNSIPFVEDVSSDLEGYATEKAMDGLFFMIAKEEMLIRKDPSARATELLKKVFKEQD
jgi:hypothetical protein